jgi:hypothetical protein
MTLQRSALDLRSGACALGLSSHEAVKTSLGLEGSSTHGTVIWLSMQGRVQIYSRPREPIRR